MKLACLYFQEDPTCLGDASLFIRNSCSRVMMINGNFVSPNRLVPFCQNCTASKEAMRITDELMAEYALQEIIRS